MREILLRLRDNNSQLEFPTQADPGLSVIRVLTLHSSHSVFNCGNAQSLTYLCMRVGLADGDLRES